ncbi:hypothetical protein C8J57DRAFT_1093137, partial [Mycena rebaudengoi]
ECREPGAEYNTLLAVWTQIEKACKFESPALKLSAKGRPEQVKLWIQSAQGKQGQANPVVDNVVKYAEVWWGWWKTLQPDWRTSRLDGCWLCELPYRRDWEPLMHWGPNGTLSVVMSLYFWGCAVQDDAVMREKWEDAVEDVAWILEGLALFHEQFNKCR